MDILLILLILALIFGVGGAFIHSLWIIAAVLVVSWLIGLLAGRTRGHNRVP